MTAPLRNTFAAVTTPARRKPPRPISIRVTHEERAQLESEAGERTLSAYARSRLFGGESRRRGPDRRPSIDSERLARLLGFFGKSNLVANIEALAYAARIGALEDGPELLKALQGAQAELASIRRELMRALGVSAS